MSTAIAAFGLVFVLAMWATARTIADAIRDLAQAIRDTRDV